MANPVFDWFEIKLLLWNIKLDLYKRPNYDDPDNIHLLHKGIGHCMADHVFDWFRFHQSSKSALNNSTQAKQLIVNKQNRRSAVMDTYIYEVSEYCLV